MRTDRALGPADVIGAGGRQRGRQPDGAPRCDVLERHRHLVAGQLLVGESHLGRERGDELHACRGQLLADLSQLGVPHVERDGDLGRQAATSLLEQTRPLAQDPVEIGSAGIVTHRQGHCGVVQEPATLGGPALDEHEVVGGEDADPQNAEEVAGARQPLAVHLHPTASRPRQFGLDKDLAAVVVTHLGAYDGPVDPGPHEGVVRRTAEAVERGEVPDGFDEVRLALPVATDDDGEAFGEDQLGLDVVAEVGEPEATDEHQDDDEGDEGIDRRENRGSAGRRRPEAVRAPAPA